MRLPAQKPSGAGAVGGCEGAVLRGGEGRAGVTTEVTTGVTRWLQLCCPTVGIGVGGGEIHGHGAASLELHPKGRLGIGFVKIFLLSPKSVDKSKPCGFWPVLVLGAREHSQHFPWCDASLPALSGSGVTFRAHPSFWFKPGVLRAYPVHVLDKSCSTRPLSS